MQPYGGSGHCIGDLFSHTVKENLTTCLAICASSSKCRYASYREVDIPNCALYETDTCTLNRTMDYKTFIKSGLYILVYYRI